MLSSIVTWDCDALSVGLASSCSSHGHYSLMAMGAYRIFPSNTDGKFLSRACCPRTTLV